MMKKPTKSGYGNSVFSFYMSKNRILTSIKGCNSATNFLKMTLYYVANVQKILVKFCPLVLKILSGN